MELFKFHVKFGKCGQYNAELEELVVVSVSLKAILAQWTYGVKDKTLREVEEAARSGCRLIT